MQSEQLKELAINALEDIKATDVTTLDVRGITSITDFMIIASANSGRHLKALADNVVEQAKAQGCRPIGVEGEREGEWALVDLGDVVVHVMLPKIREFYQLEKLWNMDAPAVADSDGAS